MQKAGAVGGPAIGRRRPARTPFELPERALPKTSEKKAEDETREVEERRSARRQLLAKLGHVPAPPPGPPPALQPKVPKKLSLRPDSALQALEDLPEDGDMFGDDATAKAPTAGAAVDRSRVQDTCDDAEGYYHAVLGEALDDGRYIVSAVLGRGVFSSVVRASETATGHVVAIKLIRANDTMREAGVREAAYLRRLCAADPDDRWSVVRLERHFEHRGHYCLVFERLAMNLRELLQRYGRGVGLSLDAVRSYAQQSLRALALLRRCGIIHADVKPDNLLVDESRAVLKLADFGSAVDADDAQITPYLASRFYRAPEVVLGAPYDHAIDVWSIGCTLFELYTGTVLFPGRTNNHMLRLMQDVLGRFPVRLSRRGVCARQHFDFSSGRFLEQTVDRLTGQATTRDVALPEIAAAAGLRARVLRALPVSLQAADPAAGTYAAATPDGRLVHLFVDLLSRLLEPVPLRRISAHDALSHDFFRDS